MAITHETDVRDGLANYVVDQLDAGSVQFRTAGNVAVATCPFGTPAFGASAAGVATANAITSDTNAAGGTIANFILRRAAATTVLGGTVTATGGGGDITITSLAVGLGDTVDVDSLTYAASL